MGLGDLHAIQKAKAKTKKKKEEGGKNMIVQGSERNRREFGLF